MDDKNATQPNPTGVTDILSEYVRRRQQGSSPEQVIAYLKPLLERLRTDARQQLAALIRSWESREGSKYRPVAKPNAFTSESETLLEPAPDEDLSWLPQPPVVIQNAPVHPSVAQEPAAPAQTFHCPQCGRPAQLGDAYCSNCGAILNVTSSDTRNLQPGEEDLYQVGQSHFPPSSALVLTVRGHNQPLVIAIAHKPELILGRSVPNAKPLPDIDLAPFQAAEMGVSRQHARLRYQDNTITITDLGSANNTYVNGQRLHPHEVRVVRDGDEIRLGRLILQVAFRHQVRPLR